MSQGPVPFLYCDLFKRPIGKRRLFTVYSTPKTGRDVDDSHINVASVFSLRRRFVAADSTLIIPSDIGTYTLYYITVSKST